MNGQKSRTSFPGLSFLPKTRTATTRERKSAPSSKNGREMIINIIRNTLRFIALSMVKTIATPPGSAKSSKQRLRIKKSLNIQQKITRGIPEK